jgi:hypothetical protein
MKNRFFFMGLLVLIVALMVGCSQSLSPDYQQTTLKSSNLVNGAITVKAGSYYNVTFSITSAMANSKVIGSFTASGGSGNDIIALVIDDMSYTNWINGHQVSTLYNSGQLTTANVNVSITTPGTYHLVFSNTFSTFTSKQVSTSVNLQWYQ